MKWPDFVYLFVGIIIPSYKIIDWVVSTFGTTFAKFFIKTEREVAIWYHYQQRSRGEGHAPKKPHDCSDGSCVWF